MKRPAHSPMMALILLAVTSSVFGQLLAAPNITQVEQYQQCREKYKLFRSKLLDIRKECPAPLPSSCCQLKGTFFASRSGVYELKEQCTIGKRKTYAYCDMVTDGGGWLVIQRRFNGKVPFDRTLEEYENGFGDISGEFWYGLKNILCLTTGKTVDLRIDLEYPTGTTAYVHYKNFSISTASRYAASVTLFRTSSGAKSNFFNPQRGGYNRYNRNYNQQLYDPYFYVKTNCGSNPNVGGWWDTSCRGNPNGPGPGQPSAVYAMWNDKVVTKTEIKIRQRSCITNPALRCLDYQQY